MSAPRFYCPPPLSLVDYCELPTAAAHHASRVLRLREGDAVQIFDGLGGAMNSTLQAITGKQVRLGTLHVCPKHLPAPLHIVLAQAICSHDKMDWIVQKATELGVNEIIPLQTARSVAKLSAERADKKIEHWRGVAISACEQCGRNDLPLIHPVQEIKSWLATPRPPNVSQLIFLPTGAHPLPAFARPNATVYLLIGAEGGLDESEEKLALQMKFIPTLLGPRVLRTETAAIAGVTALQTLWGDFGSI